MYRVQIVDDEPIMRIGLRSLIDWNKYGFEIYAEAQNGEEAYQQMKKQSFDVIVTDIEMPIMDGLDYIKKLREENYNLPIIILTAYGEFRYAKRAIQYHVTDYILKPIEDEQIDQTLTALRKRMDEARKAQGLLPEKRELSKRIYTVEYDHSLVQRVIQCDAKYTELLAQIKSEEQSSVADMEGTYLRCLSILQDLVKKCIKKYHNIDKLYNLDQYVEVLKNNLTQKEELFQCFTESIQEIYQIIQENNLSYSTNVVRQACQYVVEHIDEKVTLTLVSDTLAISKNYLCSLFKQETGENFLAYLSRVKMQRAKFLLKEKNMKVYEVCDMLGYIDTAYFTKLFKKFNHITPGEYKKADCESYEAEDME